MANYTSVVASNICDASGNKLASGTVSFQATDAANQPLNFQVGGGGQVVTTPATATITAGVIAGGFQVADSANTSPAGILYRITIADTTLNRVVATYSLVTVTGTTFNLDNYVPIAASVLPPTGGSVNGPLTVVGNLSVTGSFNPGTLGNVTSTGTILAKNIEGARYADQFANIQAAITDAGTSGIVVIPPNYVGADSYSNPNNVNVIDLRQQSDTSGALALWHGITGSRPVTNLPLGNDVLVAAHGPADIPLTNYKLATTTATTLNIGANASVLVGSTANFTTIGALELGRGTTNHEFVASGSWSIVDGMHFSITCAKSHGGTTDIEQVGTVAFDGGGLVINAAQAPAQTPTAPYPILDGNLAPIMFLPRNTEQAGNVTENVMLGANVGLVFLPSNTLPPTNYSILELSTGGALANFSPSVFSLGFIGPLISYSPNPAASGIIQLANSDGIKWRNGTNTNDLSLVANSGNQLLYVGLVVSDGVHANGLTIASGTATLGTSAVPAGTAATVVTVAASGVLATDSIAWSFNAAPGTGYTSGLHVLAYATSGNVSFLVVNPTAGSLTPAAATLNWRVVR